MPYFLMSGKDARGRAVTELVAADSATDAARQFRDRGFTDVVLHSDDVAGHALDPTAVEGPFTPADFVALGRLSRAGLVWWNVKRLYWMQRVVFGLMLAFLVGRRAVDLPWDFVDAIIVLYLLAPLPLVLLLEFLGPGRRFDRAMTFLAWGKGEEALDALRSVGSVLKDPVRSFFEAVALTRAGRLDEALAKLRPFAEHEETPSWLYWVWLSDVFWTAGQRGRMIECLEKAFAHAPDNPSVLVNLAAAYLLVRGDAARARPLLERARAQEISDVLAPILEGTEGELALAEGRPEVAVGRLMRALELFRPLRPAAPLVGAQVDRVHTYLCLAYAAAGDRDAAARHFRLAGPRLIALGHIDLLDRCRDAAGVG